MSDERTGEQVTTGTPIAVLIDNVDQRSKDYGDIKEMCIRDRAGIVQGSVGKASFGEAQLTENIRAFFEAVSKAKPAGAKGTYMQRAAISSTMGPGIRLDLATLVTAAQVGT